MSVIVLAAYAASLGEVPAWRHSVLLTLPPPAMDYSLGNCQENCVCLLNIDNFFLQWIGITFSDKSSDHFLRHSPEREAVLNIGCKQGKGSVIPIKAQLNTFLHERCCYTLSWLVYFCIPSGCFEGFKLRVLEWRKNLSWLLHFAISLNVAVIDLLGLQWPKNWKTDWGKKKKELKEPEWGRLLFVAAFSD